MPHERTYPDADLTQVVGRAIKQPETKRVGADETRLVTITIASRTGYGDEKRDRLTSVQVWPSKTKGEWLQDWVVQNVHKGDEVAAEGYAGTREYEGKSYANLRAFRIGLIDWAVPGTKAPARDDEF